MIPEIGGKPPKSSILIGFSIIFTIHFGVPVFLETPIEYDLGLVNHWFPFIRIISEGGMLVD